MPSSTAAISAPTVSQRVATALTKLSLVARKALVAYLISSAELGSVTRTGTGKGSYSAATLAAEASSVAPMITRSGFMKSSMAVPSRRNSGLETTAASGLPSASNNV